MGGASPQPVPDHGAVVLRHRQRRQRHARLRADRLRLAASGRLLVQCLEDPCAGGGRCVNYEKKGYVRLRGTGRAGDHRQLDAATGELADPAFVWYGLNRGRGEPTGTPDAGSPPPPAAPPPPPTMLIAHLPAASITETSTLDLALRVADDVAALLDIPRGRVVVLSAHFPADAEHAEVTFIDSASADDAPAAAELHATLLALQRDGALNLAGAQCEESSSASPRAPPPTRRRRRRWRPRTRSSRRSRRCSRRWPSASSAPSPSPSRCCGGEACEDRRHQGTCCACRPTTVAPRPPPSTSSEAGAGGMGSREGARGTQCGCLSRVCCATPVHSDRLDGKESRWTPCASGTAQPQPPFYRARGRTRRS